MDQLQNSAGGGASGGGRLNVNPLEGPGNTEVVQFLDSYQSTLRSKGLNEQAVREMMQAMQHALRVLAEYNIMGLGLRLGMAGMATMRNNSTSQRVPTSQAPAPTGQPSVDPGNQCIQQITQDNQPLGGGEQRNQGAVFMDSQAVDPSFVQDQTRASIPTGNGALLRPGGSNGFSAFFKSAASGQNDPGGMESRGSVDHVLDGGRQWDRGIERSSSMIGQIRWDSREQRSSLGGGGAGGPPQGAPWDRGQSYHGSERSIAQSVMRKQELDVRNMDVPWQAEQLLDDFDAAINEGEQPAVDFDSGEAQNPQESEPNGKAVSQEKPLMDAAPATAEPMTETEQEKTDGEKNGEAVEENEAGVRGIFDLVGVPVPMGCLGKKSYSERFSVAVEAEEIKNWPVEKSLTRQNSTDLPESGTSTPTEEEMKGIILFPGKAVLATYLIRYGPTSTLRKLHYFNTNKAKLGIERLCKDGLLSLVEPDQIPDIPTIPARARKNVYRKLPLDSEKLNKLLEKYGVSREQYTAAYRASSCKDLQCLNNCL